MNETGEKTFVFSFGSFAGFLKSQSERLGDKEAVISIDIDTGEAETISYRKLFLRSIQAANFLFARGLRKGDRFGILMENDPDTIVLELAGGIMGCTAVPLDSKRDTEERKIFKLCQTEAKLLFAKDACTDSVRMRRDAPGLKVFDLNSAPLSALANDLPDIPLFLSHGSLETDYVILYTSGTTASPKGVPLTIRACMANADGIVRWQRLSLNDRFNIVLPLHHINSTIFYLATLLAGGTVLLNSRYSVSKFWEVIETERATITSLVPTALHDLLARSDDYFAKNYDISSMKRVLIGSAPVLPEETLRFRETFQIDVVQGYGQTETALRVTGVPIDLDTETYLDLVRKNSIGVALANCEVTILKDGKEADENEEGEICIRGPVLAQGYLNDAEGTARSFVNGWFHSGDLGCYRMIGGRKFFFIKGRIKEIIIKGGVNISPAAVEDAILKTYSEIEEVCVVGYPDPRMGEEVAAFLYFKDCPDEKKKEILSRMVADGNAGKLGISRYEAPQMVFEVKDELPKTSTGKIKRTEMKQSLVAGRKQKEYRCRVIQPDEEAALSKAVEINNARWNIPSTPSEFKNRATHGYVIGVFDETDRLLGTVSAMQVSEEALDTVSTWDSLTANGSLRTRDEQGTVLLCIAISVEREGASPDAESPDPPISQDRIEILAQLLIDWYVQTNLDAVIRFHRKPKGGCEGGRVVRIFPKSRNDQDALGYNVLIEYPKIKADTVIVPSNDSPSVSLIEYALLLAKEKGCKKVMAFSRPAQFKFYLIKALEGASVDHPEFPMFYKQVQEKLSSLSY